MTSLEDELRRLKSSTFQELKSNSPINNFETTNKNTETTNFKHFASYNYTYDIDEIKLHFFLSNIKKLKLTLKVHQAYKLVTVNQLSQLDWLAADYEVIKRLQSKYL